MYDSSQQIEKRITTIATIPLLLLLLLILGRESVVVNLNMAFFGNWWGEGMSRPALITGSPQGISSIVIS